MAGSHCDSRDPLGDAGGATAVSPRADTGSLPGVCPASALAVCPGAAIPGESIRGGAALSLILRIIPFSFIWSIFIGMGNGSAE